MSPKSSLNLSLDGRPVHIANFEEVDLADDEDADDFALNPRPVSRTHQRGILPTFQSGHHTAVRPGYRTESMDPVRDLIGPGRPPYPGLREHVSRALTYDGHSGLQVGYGNGKRQASQSDASLASTPQGGHLAPSRSPSPRRLSRRSKQSRLVQNGNMGRRQSAPTITEHPRRSGSWQPKGKSVKELEEECRDSDEDVPDDAVFWNVPLSPRLLHQRTGSFASGKSTPQVSSVSQFEIPVRSGTARPQNQFIHSNSQPILKQNQLISPSSTVSGTQRGPGTVLASSPTASHRQDRFPPSRTLSWDAALSELSEETKTLTEALEAHAAKENKPFDHGANKGPHSPVRQGQSSRRMNPRVISLPAVRKDEIAADPLPISKEKEAVLSRTRPSWLPPKSQKEERKHLKEFQRMMARSIESDRQKAENEERARQARDNTRMSLLRIWDHHIMPNWDRLIRERRTRELWWLGIPPRSRGLIWQRAAGNGLELVEITYNTALKRAKEMDVELQRQPESLVQQAQRERNWFQAIRRDARSSIWGLGIFRPGGPLHEVLVDVLMAYSMYRSDVGYVHGTHLMAALLLLNLPTTQAFIVLSNLLDSSLPLAFLMNDSGAIGRTYDLTLRSLQYKFPDVHKHLTTTLQLAPESYLEPMFRTMFTKCVPLDHASRIWDVHVFEGNGFLVRTAVAVLGRLEEGGLHRSRDEVLQRLGWGATTMWDLGDEDDFMLAVRSAGKEDRERRMTDSLTR